MLFIKKYTIYFIYLITDQFNFISFIEIFIRISSTFLLIPQVFFIKFVILSNIYIINSILKFVLFDY